MIDRQPVCDFSVRGTVVQAIRKEEKSHTIPGTILQLSYSPHLPHYLAASIQLRSLRCKYPRMVCVAYGQCRLMQPRSGSLCCRSTLIDTLGLLELTGERTIRAQHAKMISQQIELRPVGATFPTKVHEI